MITILYQAGDFGSTLEYCLRTYSMELTKTQGVALQDNGSMHGFEKQLHLTDIKDFERLKESNFEVVTTIYPNFNYLSPQETIRQYQQHLRSQDPVIFVHGATVDQQQRGRLFAYRKLGTKFLSNIVKDKAQAWNSNYTHWTEMKRSELRECLSFWCDYQTEFVGLADQVPQHWFKVTTDDILLDLESTVKKILQHCNLCYNYQNISDFYLQWFDKQQPILQEWQWVVDIVDSVLNNQHLTWPDISILGEAMVQSRLNQHGMKLACFELEQFPNNTVDLKKLILQNEH